METTKTSSADPKVLLERLYAKLEPTYDLCTVDYRDEVPGNVVQECLDARSATPLYEKALWDDQRNFYAQEIISDLLKDEGLTPDQEQEFLRSEEYLKLVWEIQDRDHSSPMRNTCSQTVTHAYIRFHSNYDCWLPIWEQGGIQVQGTALGGILAALSLNPKKVKEAAVRRGITTYGAFRDIPSREGKELVDYTQFVRVLSETPNYGNWAFFGTLDLAGLLGKNFKPDDMFIPTDTKCCMFNWWNGGGSLDFCRTLRPVTVKELQKRLSPYSDDLKVIVDEGRNNHGYTPCDVYGRHLSEETCLAA